MKISFGLKKGDFALGIEYFWSIRIEDASDQRILDSFIPELFYDYLYLKSGTMSLWESEIRSEIDLPNQTLKTLFTQRLDLILRLPIEIFGARLSLRFAESFWERNLLSNQVISTDWVEDGVANLDEFASKIKKTIKNRSISKPGGRLLSADLQEEDWFAHFSPRHKRRIFKSVYGLSKKDLFSIRNIHKFLGETCDFDGANPRILHHINSDVFFDQPHLNRMFKKFTGFSPVEYFEASTIIQDNLLAVSYNAI